VTWAAALAADLTWKPTWKVGHRDLRNEVENLNSNIIRRLVVMFMPGSFHLRLPRGASCAVIP
jgi:hypothetical protein